MSTPETPHSEEKVIYTARAHTTGGRDGGASRTSDGRLDVKFSLPGSAGQGTNPEQLLSVGWSACFLSALGIAAGKMKVALPADASIDAEIDLRTGAGGYTLGARLNISLPGLPTATARALTEAAELLCPYSKGLKGNVGVEISLI